MRVVETRELSKFACDDVLPPRRGHEDGNAGALRETCRTSLGASSAAEVLRWGRRAFELAQVDLGLELQRPHGGKEEPNRIPLDRDRRVWSREPAGAVDDPVQGDLPARLLCSVKRLGSLSDQALLQLVESLEQVGQGRREDRSSRLGNVPKLRPFSDFFAFISLSP